jgi:dehydrogenase/reductase SDR family protein 7B
LAKRFVELGAKQVIITARRVAELERVRNECKDPSKVVIMQMDLSDPEKVLKQAEEFTLSDRVDILINNGGTSMREEFINTELNMWTSMMNANCMSHIALIKGFLPRMIK